MAAPDSVIGAQDVEAAAERIAGHIRVTPVLRPGLGTFGLDLDLVLKLELLQHTGSFKPRGAFNRILASSVPAAGVIAASGGNHAAAVAHAATVLGLPAEIHVPEAAPAIKLEALARYPVDVRRSGTLYDDAQAACDLRAAETGALVCHPYDLAEVLAGHGTLARELEGQAPEIDTVLVAAGGGGLIGGVASWYRGRTKVVAVEPETSRCLGAALDAGEPVDVTVAGLASDSLGVRRVGNWPFAAAQAWVSEAVAISDDAIACAQRALWRETRLVVEPGGAAALAALLAGAYVPESDERVAVLVCGANTDPPERHLMERTEHVETPVAAPVLFAVVEDLARYADWLDIVVTATPTEALSGDDGPAWTVELRGRIGPLARSKRLRMVRVSHVVPERVVFERREPGERDRSPWTLTALVEPTETGSRLTMSLQYGGALWGSMIERLLADEVDRARPRLLALLTD